MSLMQLNACRAVLFIGLDIFRIDILVCFTVHKSIMSFAKVHKKNATFFSSSCKNIEY